MDKITQEEIDQLKQRNAELESQLVEVNNNRTGIAPCARFCEALAAKKMFDNLQTRNAELMAQVSRLRKALEFFADDELLDIEAVSFANDVLHETPSQCLVDHNIEVAARAVEKAINLCQHSFGSWENAITGSLGVADYELQEYANKIKSGEVEV